MADTYKLQYDGMTLTYPGLNGYVSYEAAPAFKTLTLYHSEGGTLTANELTGYPGDTINLSTAYNTYWRFSGYQWTGDGTLANNTYTFGTEDASICACYKVNAFTASGGFEKGSDVTCSANGNWVSKTATVPAKYATVSYHTSNVPTAWYNTSNRWKITSTVSAYKITLNPKMGFQGQKKDTTNYGQGGRVTAVSLIGSTQTQSQSFSTPTGTAVQNWSYNKSFTSNTTGVNYGISAKLSAFGALVAQRYYDGWSKYIANRTSGTWTATGYAP